jgi:serine/threonine protein kinase/WD40 repeat protein
MPLNSERVQSVFLRAVEVADTADRAALLAHECGHDTELRRRVEALLQASDRADSFLEPPVRDLNATAAERVAEGPGTVIGPYKLMEQIGEGGMGLVFVAEQQQPVRRKVALKVIKPGMDSRAIIARFEAERQALALMDHPNIAKIHDGGETATGRPYFVMELVKGVPITEYCDQNEVPIRERLELFGHVCDAVQHAHQKGIIHRDIKPSNVLVMSNDGVPVVKVIDFGVAKAIGQQLTDKTLYTQFAQLVGTPLYMSPEQAGQSSVDIDTRTDIYALGVLLYELLTGTTPFDKERLKDASYDEIRRIIREEEPPKPSTRISTMGQASTTISTQRKSDPKRLSALFRGELDWIVMKALEKDRNRRYETANGVAMDVQRYLADEPVQACPPSAAYRFRKLVRRNKVLFATVTTVAVTLLVAAAAVTWKWRDAETARQQEQTAKEQAEEAEKQAREDRDKTLQAERMARLREAEALVGQAHGIRLSRRPGQRFDALAALGKAAAIGRELGQPAGWFDQLRNEAIAALALPDIHITKEFGSFPPGSVWVDLSDDFELYVRTTDKGSCTIRRVADDTKVSHLPELGEPAHAEFGSDRILAVHGRSTQRFQLWDVSGDKPALRFEEHGITSWRFHPRGHLLAVAHSDGPISVYDVATGTRLYRLEAREVVQRSALLFHPTMPFLATSSYWSCNIFVYDLRTGAVVASAVTPWRNSWGAWSPDGRTLTVPPGDQGQIQQYAFDPEAPALRLMRALPATQTGANISYNPRGDRFVDHGWGSKVNLFDTASGQVLFSTHAVVVNHTYWMRFDRTGHRLAATRVGDRSDRIGLWSVADAREYMSVRHAGANEAVENRRLAIHPSGRLAATNLMTSVALFDLDSGRELAQLPTGPRGCGLCFDGTGNLLTNSFAGFYRWPIQPDPASPGRLLLGPPERLPFHAGDVPISASQDGRVIAQSMWHGYGMPGGGWILHPNFRTPRQVEAGTSVRPCSVSPDGRWVAFGGPGIPLTVYESASTERVWQLPGRQNISGRFSPDGRWLVTDADGGRLYAVGTWEPGPQLGPGIPWDMTFKLAVLGLSNGIYRLVELATGRELARLEDPERNTGPAAFTPDGTKLVVAAKDGLRVWDLRRIRQELAKLDLDWVAPAYLPVTEAATSPSLALKLNLGEFARAATPEEKARQTIAAYHLALKSNPKSAIAHNNLAWAYATAPEALRKPQEAVRLAEEAVRQEPDNATFRNTLGAAYYRAGRYREAADTLEANLKNQDARFLAHDLYFLALACRKLGETDKARVYYQWALLWTQSHKELVVPCLEELDAFRAEAAELLGIKDAKK